jgi:hypothetical protein
MMELPDDELDKLFRKSSEEFDPIYEPNDWNDLTKRLDAEEGKKPAGLWRKWWPLGLLLFGILGGGFLFGLKENGAKRATARDEQKGRGNNSVGNRSKDVASSRLEGNEHLGEPENVVSNPDREVNEEITKGNEDKTKSNTRRMLPLSRSKAGGVYLEPNRSSGKVGEGAFFWSAKSVEKAKKLANEDRSKLGKPGDSDQQDQLVSKKNESDVEIVQTETLHAGKGASDTITENQHVSRLQKGIAENGLNLSDPTSQTDEGPWLADQEMLSPRLSMRKKLASPGVEGPEPEPVIPNEESTKTSAPLFAVRFGYAPDMSSVGLKNFSRPGSAVSMMAEWAVFKRAYLQVGTIWSNKVYNANAGDYQISWLHYYGPYPTTVEGECKVFEVPLNVRFDIFQGEVSRWFASAGTTSYHMNSEWYKYYYENESDPKIDKRSRADATGWYLFSHLNASAGYEYRLTRRLSLIAEPYVRIPLKRVGYGKVNLFTTGAWISIRYTPVFRRN